MTQNKEVRWVRLGDFIDKLKKKCGVNDAIVSGIDINKSFIDTRANLVNTDISKYYLVPPKYFACNLMHIGRDEKIPIAFNGTERNRVVTSAYYVFTITAEKRSRFLAEYINTFFHLKEFDRRTYFFTDSSVRGNLKEERFLDIQIPVPYKDGEPDVERQQEIVNVWQGLRRLKEENEALAKPLLELCDAKMDDLKHSAPMVELGEFIEQVNERNSDNRIKKVLGISTQKEFRIPQSRVDYTKINNYKIVDKNNFVYVPTTDTWKCLAICLSRESEKFVVSPIYTVFRLIHKEFLPDFLHLYFKRREFDRYARYQSWGSARENFSWEEMCRVKVPKPSLEVQKAIVDIYHCARRAKEIAAEADKQLKEICPALMQHVIHS